MRRLVLIGVAAVLAGAVALAQNKRVNVTFAPQNEDPQFDAAADEYRRIWAAEGGRMIEAMERISKLKFPDKNVKAEIYEGPSFSGRGNAPMRLRASYSTDMKKGTLVHELGHRMNAQLRRRPVDLDEHRLLFLYLYDLYEDLYGKSVRGCASRIRQDAQGDLRLRRGLGMGAGDDARRAAVEVRRRAESQSVTGDRMTRRGMLLGAFTTAAAAVTGSIPPRQQPADFAGRHPGEEREIESVTMIYGLGMVAIWWAPDTARRSLAA